MRRFVLVVLGGLLLNTSVFAIQDGPMPPEIIAKDEAPSGDGDKQMVGEYPAAVAVVVAERNKAPEAQSRQQKIIPGLPKTDPDTRKWYRLQVGAFSVMANAEEYERRARALGFITEREQYGSLTRVLIMGILAADVKLAAQELEEAGFTEVWVREY